MDEKTTGTRQIIPAAVTAVILLAVFTVLRTLFPEAAAAEGSDASGNAAAPRSESPAGAAQKAFRVEAGERMADIAAGLEAAGILSAAEFAAAANELAAELASGSGGSSDGFGFPPEFLRLPVSGNGGPAPEGGFSRFEGLVPPGEYLIGPDAGAGEVLEKLLSHAAARLGTAAGTEGLPAYRLLTLASIVEKETGKDGRYELVAGVLYNRLRGGEPLAVCSSVEYALGYHRPFLTIYDVMTDSPYNLYIHEGLPPTPICTVSDRALQAAREPAETLFRYFVYDWTTDSLLFAETYDQHKTNADRAHEHYRIRHGVSEMYRKNPGKFYEE